MESGDVFRREGSSSPPPSSNFMPSKPSNKEVSRVNLLSIARLKESQESISPRSSNLSRGESVSQEELTENVSKTRDSIKDKILLKEGPERLARLRELQGEINRELYLSYPGQREKRECQEEVEARVAQLTKEGQELLEESLRFKQKGQDKKAQECKEKRESIELRLKNLNRGAQPADRKAVMGLHQNLQGKIAEETEELARLYASKGMLPTEHIKSEELRGAFLGPLLTLMDREHIKLLEGSLSHLEKARDYFLGEGRLPPKPCGEGGLSYALNDLLIGAMAQKIRKDDLPGAITKMEGGSGGVYKLSTKTAEGVMEPLFVFKIEDEEPGGEFCRKGFEEGTLDPAYPSDEGLIREEFINRSPLDPRHAVRQVLEHHAAFNASPDREMPSRAGVVLPFVKGGRVLEGLGVSKLKTEISHSRISRGASQEEKEFAERRIEFLNREIARKEQEEPAEKFGIVESLPPSKWPLWDKVNPVTGQCILAKICAYGNTDANDGNIMVLLNPKGEIEGAELYDFDYGRAVPRAMPEGYGLVSFRDSPFATASILPSVKKLIMNLNIEEELERMESLWLARKPQIAREELEGQKRLLRAHMELLKVTAESKSNFSLADLFQLLDSGALKELIDEAQGENGVNWEEFKSIGESRYLVAAREERLEPLQKKEIETAPRKSRGLFSKLKKSN